MAKRSAGMAYRVAGWHGQAKRGHGVSGRVSMRRSIASAPFPDSQRVPHPFSNERVANKLLFLAIPSSLRQDTPR